MERTGTGSRPRDHYRLAVLAPAHAASNHRLPGRQRGKDRISRSPSKLTSTGKTLGMSLLVAVEDALDISLHMASDEGWGVPAAARLT